MPKVYLSPSTQVWNIGVGEYGNESRRMNEITDRLVPLLESWGFIVYRNRPDMSLAQVVADSNSKNVDAHIAIHSNAGGGQGTECWVYKLGYDAEKLAKCIYNELAPLSPGADRGIKENPNYYETRETKAPAVIVEIGFHDNPADAQWIMNCKDDIALAIAKGTCKYFGQKIKDEFKPAPAESSFPDAQKWVMDMGISDGSNPTTPATREQVWQMLYNFAKRK